MAINYPRSRTLASSLHKTILLPDEHLGYVSIRLLIQRNLTVREGRKVEKEREKREKEGRVGNTAKKK